MAKSFREVKRFPSNSDPTKEYTVSVDANGGLSCNCRGWTVKKPGQQRTCRHVREVEAEIDNIPAAPQPVQVGGREKGGSLTKMFGKWGQP